MATINITADGQYDLFVSKNNRSTFNVNGDFGGGTLSLGYKNASNIFTAYTNGSLTANGDLVADTGIGAKLMVNMVGSTAPNVDVEHHGHYDG